MFFFFKSDMWNYCVCLFYATIDTLSTLISSLKQIFGHATFWWGEMPGEQPGVNYKTCKILPGISSAGGAGR